MLRGIYSSAAGMMNAMEKVSMHAGNISNAQTAGFKGREMTSVPFKEMMINVMNDQGEMGSELRIGGKNVRSIKLPVGTGAGAGYMEVNSAQGSMKPTGGTFDLAIDGGGWFTLQRKGEQGEFDPAGEQFSTRNGRFMLDTSGTIINAEGHFLLGESGSPIKINLDRGEKIADDEGVVIREDGTVLQDSNVIAKLKIKRDTVDKTFIPQLNLAVMAQEDATDMKDVTGKQIKVKQGFVESSNVQIITEMIGLIHSSKTYESGHKLIMNADKILDKAINELGRTS